MGMQNLPSLADVSFQNPQRMPTSRYLDFKVCHHPYSIHRLDILRKQERAYYTHFRNGGKKKKKPCDLEKTTKALKFHAK